MVAVQVTWLEPARKTEAHFSLEKGIDRLNLRNPSILKEMQIILWYVTISSMTWIVY